jgi:hypothetical protein
MRLCNRLHRGPGLGLLLADFFAKVFWRSSTHGAKCVWRHPAPRRFGPGGIHRLIQNLETAIDQWSASARRTVGSRAIPRITVVISFTVASE